MAAVRKAVAAVLFVFVRPVKFIKVGDLCGSVVRRLEQVLFDYNEPFL